MGWRYVKKLTSVNLIDEFEQLVEYKFCESFKKCVLINNGGRLNKKCFLAEKSEERVLKSFLSFNKEDKENVWDMFEWIEKEIKKKYIPFAIDNFGNLVCFDKSNDKIVFVNNDNMSVQIVAETFDDFLKTLY